MQKSKLHILLADDDIDDCEFFQEAIDEVLELPSLSIINNGVELMSFLKNGANIYPDIIFLDLNMPKKSGMECIAEIKALHQLSHIPIIIYSTSLDDNVLDRIYQLGVHSYIQKPAEFASIKKVVQKAISILTDPEQKPRSRANFVIQL